MAPSAVGAKSLQKVWEGLGWEGMWPLLDLWDVVGYRTTASIWNVPKKYGPYGELFFFFLKKKELVVLREMVNFGHYFPVETIKACAIFGLHMMAEENASLSNSGLSPDLGDMWRYGFPKALIGTVTPVTGQEARDMFL